MLDVHSSTENPPTQALDYWSEFGKFFLTFNVVNWGLDIDWLPLVGWLGAPLWGKTLLRFGACHSHVGEEFLGDRPEPDQQSGLGVALATKKMVSPEKLMY